MPFTWEGWGKCDFGLEMQSPWAGLLLEGKKTIETRAYDLPPALLGRRIDILQSKTGSTVSSLGNVVAVGAVEDEATVRRVGWCTFTRVIRYQDRESFEADEAAHLVKKDSAFGWKEGITKVVYGWVVGTVSCLNGGTPQDDTARCSNCGSMNQKVVLRLKGERSEEDTRSKQSLPWSH